MTEYSPKKYIAKREHEDAVWKEVETLFGKLSNRATQKIIEDALMGYLTIRETKILIYKLAKRNKAVRKMITDFLTFG